jgi:hypothetical protein
MPTESIGGVHSINAADDRMVAANRHWSVRS